MLWMEKAAVEITSEGQESWEESLVRDADRSYVLYFQSFTLLLTTREKLGDAPDQDRSVDR